MASGNPKVELLRQMPFYRSRITQMLGALETGAPLSLGDFTMAYTEDGALESAAEFFDGCNTLVELGCGFGGAVLWFAQRYEDLRALAGIDLVDEHIQIARSLRQRLLGDDFRVSFAAANLAASSITELADLSGLDEADALLSLNVAAHLTPAERDVYWQLAGQLLAPAGRMFIEDFFQLRTPDENEASLLAGQLSCADLPTMADYADTVARGLGVQVVAPMDLTLAYAAFAERRYQTYAGEDELRREYYRAMSVLLGDGAVGALRIQVERN